MAPDLFWPYVWERLEELGISISLQFPILIAPVWMLKCFDEFLVLFLY